MATGSSPKRYQDDSDLRRLWELVVGHYRVYVVALLLALAYAWVQNRVAVPMYRVSASMLIKERPVQGQNMNDFLNSNLLGVDQNFQNELWVLKSSPVIAQAVENLGLSVSWCRESGYRQIDAYKNTPFRVLRARGHVQPINEWFYISWIDSSRFLIQSRSKRATFREPDVLQPTFQKEKWSFEQEARFGELIENEEMAFVVELDSAFRQLYRPDLTFGFLFSEVTALTNSYKQQIEFNIVQRDATIVELVLRSTSVAKAEDLLNEIMAVYAQQNLDRKNYIADITIAYIDAQLAEISDSLSETEHSLQSFRSSSQLLNVPAQTNELSGQYRDLQNQKAELLTSKRYYDYLSDYMSAANDDYSELILPSSMGISDQLLNNLMSELIAAHAQRSALIQNRQEKNPMVQRLGQQIESLRRTIYENVSAVNRTTDIALDEMDKRIRRIEGEMARLPRNELRLGGIERQYRLNDAIYNYLLEKRAEARISQASNLPDNQVIEPAKMMGTGPFSPNRRKNYLFAVVLGLGFPFAFLLLRSILNNKLIPQDAIGELTDAPVLGKIMRNRKGISNVMQDLPRSGIAEAYRALRTNIEFSYKHINRKVILVTSAFEGEGKSFNALNLAMCYAQLNKKTLLLNLDLRKHSAYFSKQEKDLPGVSSWLSGLSTFEEVCRKTGHARLDFVPAGVLPPNPVELLAQINYNELFGHLRKQYDCVVVDATPLAQVSDAYLYVSQVDVVMVVARYHHTPKRVFVGIMEELRLKEVPNVGVLLNDASSDQSPYGYGNRKRIWR